MDAAERRVHQRVYGFLIVSAAHARMMLHDLRARAAGAPTALDNRSLDRVAAVHYDADISAEEAYRCFRERAIEIAGELGLPDPTATVDADIEETIQF